MVRRLVAEVPSGGLSTNKKPPGTHVGSKHTFLSLSDLYRSYATFKCLSAKHLSSAVRLIRRILTVSDESFLSTSDDITVVVGDTELGRC